MSGPLDQIKSKPNPSKKEDMVVLLYRKWREYSESSKIIVAIGRARIFYRSIHLPLRTLIAIGLAVSFSTGFEYSLEFTTLLLNINHFLNNINLIPLTAASYYKAVSDIPDSVKESFISIVHYGYFYGFFEIAYLLYQLKRNISGIIYGLLEIEFAALVISAAIFFRSNSNYHDHSVLFAAFGAVYVTIRGWDHMREGVDLLRVESITSPGLHRSAVMQESAQSDLTEST